MYYVIDLSYSCLGHLVNARPSTASFRFIKTSKKKHYGGNVGLVLYTLKNVFFKLLCLQISPIYNNMIKQKHYIMLIWAELLLNVG